MRQRPLSWLLAAMRANWIPAFGLAFLAAVLVLPQPAEADTRIFPKGHLFEPLLADPQRPRFFSGLTELNMGSVDNAVAPVGFGGRFGLLRWPGEGPRAGDWQLGVSAAVFSQFVVDEESGPQLNTDLILSLPLTYRSGPLSARFRAYHQSSHLGDETQEQGRTRINFSFEALEALMGWDFGPFRAYAGGEVLLAREPTNRDRGMVHTGARYRAQSPLARMRQAIRLYPVAGVDLKFRQDHNWEPAVSANAGIQFHRGLPQEGGSRHFAILALWHTGPSPFGQFFREDANFWGMTMEFTL